MKTRMNQIRKLIEPIVMIIVCLNVFPLITDAQRGDYLPYPTKLTWSPNGNNIMVSGHGFVQVIDVINGSTILDINLGPYDVPRHEWNSNGNLISFTYNNIVSVWDITTRVLVNEFNLIPLTGGFIVDFDWYHNNNILVFIERSDGTQYLTTIDPLTAQVHNQPITTLYRVSEIDISPDNRYISIRQGARYLQIWDAEQLVNLYEFYSGEDTLLIRSAWSSDSTQIVIAYYNGVIKIWDLVIHPNRSIAFTESLSFISEPEARIRSIYWSLDNSQIMIINDFAEIRIFDSQTETQLYTSGQATSNAANFSPFGGQLAYTNRFALPQEEGFTREEIRTANGVQRQFDNTFVQIVIPDPSLDRLQTIADACNAPLAIEQSLTADIETNQLSNLITQLESLPTDAIPPACAADLIAVAEAIQNQ